jgi:hypothetical protein
MEGGGGSWATQSCCETTDVKCILGYYLADAIPTPPAPGTMFPTPAPGPRRSQCVKLGEEAADWAQTTMCGQVVAFPWKDNSQLMDCRDIATRTCNKKLAGRVMQSCGRFINGQEVRRACTTAVNDLLGSAAVTEDYEVEPYEEEKFDYSYLSEDNKDPYGEDFDSSTSEDVEMESHDEDFYTYNKRANKMRRQGGNKMRRQGGNKKLVRNMNKDKGTMTRDGRIVLLLLLLLSNLSRLTHILCFSSFTTDTTVHIGGNANGSGEVDVNGNCRPGCSCAPYWFNGQKRCTCICPEDSYLSEDNKMDPYGEDFDSSTSEDVEMESYDEDFYAVY